MGSRLLVRWGNPPHVTKPTWGPSPSCKEALNSQIWKLTKQIQLNHIFLYIFDRCSTKNRENDSKKCICIKQKETRIKHQPRVSANQPSEVSRVSRSSPPHKTFRVWPRVLWVTWVNQDGRTCVKCSVKFSFLLNKSDVKIVLSAFVYMFRLTYVSCYRLLYNAWVV